MTIPLAREAGKAAAANWSRINQWLLWIGLAAAVAWTAYRHDAHVGQLLPFLILLACPLMHMFGHGAHTHRREGDASQDTQPFPAEDHTSHRA